MKFLRFWLESLGVGILAACLVPLNFYQKNYPQILGQDIAIVVGAFALIHALVWLILRLIFRNSDRACLVAYTLWGAFWFSRPVLSFIRHSCTWTQALYDLIHDYRYAVVLGVFIPVVIFGYLWLRKHPTVIKPLVKSINLAIPLELFLLVGQTGHKVHKYAQLERHQQEQAVQPDGDYPNIYHILLDAHPNLEGARLLGYDLQPFYDELNNLGFITFPQSRSNYCMTLWSVPSMLTMDYLPGDETKIKDFTLYRLSRNNPVFDTLMSHGYRVKFTASFMTELAFYPRKYTQLLLHGPLTTFIMVLETTILYNFQFNRTWFYQLQPNPKIIYHTCLKWLLSPNNHQPIYRYVHILCPHPPFVFSDNASATYGLTVQYQKNQTDSYIPQIRANIAGIDAMVLPILKQLTQQPKPPIIILHSDHGSYFGTQNNVDSNFGNLLALYIPDTWKSDAKDLKFINLYRFILNHLFNEHRPYIDQNRQIIGGKDFDPNISIWDHLSKRIM
ncbi:MAG: LTA synthase family protein [Opitutales bacterium]|nr:LTA synthase family protein [Opitutales bacterium]